MSQSSILELLSVTSNAVKALDKTSSSKSSGSGGGTPRGEGWNDVENQPPTVSGQDLHINSKSSGDSGVGKTETRSNQATGRVESSTGVHDSDDSTTASDVLIRSTLVEVDPANKPTSLNTSAASQGSRCRELDNFNVADAKKVKVSKKHLKEIVSPRDSFGSSDQPGQNLNAVLSNQNQNSRPGASSSQASLNTNNNRSADKLRGVDHTLENGKIINSYPGNVKPGVPSKHFTGNGSSKNVPEQKKKLSQGLDNSASVYTVERHRSDQKQVSTKEFPPGTELQDGSATEDVKPSSRTAQFPYKVSRHDGPSKEQLYVEQQELAEDWEGESESSLIFFSCYSYNLHALPATIESAKCCSNDLYIMASLIN